MLTSYIGFQKEGLAYAPINRTGAAIVRPKREAMHLARTLIMQHTTHPLRLVMRGGFLLALLNLLLVWMSSAASRVEWRNAFAFVVICGMLATVGEYVGALTRRLRDRPTYYVREEHTSSVLLREERTNVVGMTAL